jgi:hypothetical protein
LLCSKKYVGLAASMSSPPVQAADESLQKLRVRAFNTAPSVATTSQVTLHRTHCSHFLLYAMLSELNGQNVSITQSQLMQEGVFKEATSI